MTPVIVGTVRELGRFPVKSMLGESPASVDIGEVGVEGDRRYGLVDVETGKVASAKDPRRWAELLHCRAEYDGDTLLFTMADGVQVRGDAPDVDAVLSASLGRSVRFRSNLLLDVAGDEIVENTWTGRRLAAGDVVLEVTSPAPRCVMTTLAQAGIERDRGILRAVASHNRQEFAGFGIWACLGAYAAVITPGRVNVGDQVQLLG